MKKVVKEYSEKDLNVLQKELSTLQAEVAKLRLEMKVNPTKDSNEVAKKKRRIAILMTLITSKKLSK